MLSDDGRAVRAMAFGVVSLAFAAPSLASQQNDGALRAPGEPTACAEGDSGIQGHVNDLDTGLPLPTARVTVLSTSEPEPPASEEESAGQESRSAEADPTGAFALCRLEPGRWALEVEFQDVVMPAETVSVPPATSVPHDVAIPLGRPGRLDGRVMTGEERTAVGGALVTLDPLGLQVLTDSAGTFVIDPVPPARYRIAIHHVAGLRIDSLEVRPRGRVTFESRLIARDVVLGSAPVGPMLRGARERPLEGEVSVEGERPRRVTLGAAGRVAGVLLDRSLLRTWKANRLSQALTLVPGLELVRRCVGQLTTACGFLPRLTPDAACTEAAVYVDGRPVPAGPLLRLLNRLPVEDLESVQVIEPGEPMPEGLGEGPPECGAVLVWRSPES